MEEERKATKYFSENMGLKMSDSLKPPARRTLAQATEHNRENSQ